MWPSYPASDTNRLKAGGKEGIGKGCWRGVGVECDVWVRRERRTGFRCRNLKAGDHLEDLGVDGRIILMLENYTGRG